MLARHHGDVGGGKQKEAESEAMSMGGCQSWGVRAAPVLADPVMLECCVCSGPYISYALEDTWQPRQRTQVSGRHRRQQIKCSHTRDVLSFSTGAIEALDTQNFSRGGRHI